MNILKIGKKLILCGGVMLLGSAGALAQDGLAATPATSSTGGPNTRLTNSSALFVEMLGRGLVYSVGYDQVINANISVGFGFGTAATERNGVVRDTRAYIIPTYVNFYLLQSAGSFYLTGGADVVVNSNKVRDDEASTSGVQFPKDVLMPTFGAGYEYRTDAGFLFRLTGYGIAGDDIKPWLGFTFGYAF